MKAAHCTVTLDQVAEGPKTKMVKPDVPMLMAREPHDPVDPDPELIFVITTGVLAKATGKLTAWVKLVCVVKLIDALPICIVVAGGSAFNNPLTKCTFDDTMSTETRVPTSR